MENKIKT